MNSPTTICGICGRSTVEPPFHHPDCPAGRRHIRSLDGDGEPLHYCAVCFQDWPCVGAGVDER